MFIHDLSVSPDVWEIVFVQISTDFTDTSSSVDLFTVTFTFSGVLGMIIQLEGSKSTFTTQNQKDSVKFAFFSTAAVHVHNSF